MSTTATASTTVSGSVCNKPAVMGGSRKKAQQLQQEAQGFGNTTYMRSAMHLQPTLAELQACSFTDFVRERIIHASNDESEESEQEEEEEEEEEEDSEQQEQQPNHHDTRSHDNDNNHDSHDSAADARHRSPIVWDRGIAKVTLPKGWWNQEGIAQDATGRGVAWQAGQKLGDLEIHHSVSQRVDGIGGIYEFTLLERSKPYKLADFRTAADKYQKKQLGRRFNDCNNETNGDNDEHWHDLAKLFWKRLGPTMEPSMYGADMEGSLFDSDVASGWGLEHLDNCLKLLEGGKNLPGVTTPYLYIGQWASVFCAHTEDLDLLSINYLHAGAPKYWYAIAPQDAKRFESLCHSHYVHSHKECREYLRHKQCLISPVLLKKAGIEFETTIQRPGDAVITYPGAYHFGVNLGFNVAEATNFAVPEWLEIGRKASICMCRPSSVRIDMDKFQALLERYNVDAENARKLGFPQLTYRQWARLEASRQLAKPKAVSSSGGSPNNKKKKSKKKMVPVEAKVGDANVSLIYDSDGNPSMKEVWVTTSMDDNDDQSSGKKKEDFWIEVVAAKGSVNKKNNKNKKRTSPNDDNDKLEKREDWRLAKPIKEKDRRSIQLQTKVLALLSSDDGQECFAGEVTEMAEGCVRIHFQGLLKKEDEWLPINSSKLFLDGGKWVEPSPKKKSKVSKQMM